MNEIKVKTRKIIKEYRDVHFADVSGLVAKSVVDIVDGVDRIHSTDFYIGGYHAYPIDELIINDYILDMYEPDDFYKNHIIPKIKPYTLDELKTIDLSTLHTTMYSNLINLKTNKSVVRWFVLQYENTAMNYNAVYDYITNAGFKTIVLEESHGLVIKCAVSTDDLFDANLIDSDGFKIFNQVSASNYLVDMWNSK